MFDYYFTFRSITGAQRGEKALMNRHIRCVLMRAPKYLSLKGCGYALKVGSSTGIAAAMTLRQYEIAFERIYRVSADGDVEDVVL